MQLISVIPLSSAQNHLHSSVSSTSVKMYFTVLNLPYSNGLERRRPFKYLNKIAFQWDAYRPRVDRISQHALRQGVSARGVYLVPGVLLRGVCSRGVSAPGVYLVLGVYLARYSPTPVDRHTPVNILPCPKLCLQAVKIALCRTQDWGGLSDKSYQNVKKGQRKIT